MIRRSAPLVAGGLAVALVAAPVLGQWSPRILWNSTPSVPVGLYWLQPVDRVAIGDLVAVRPPERLARFLAARGYLRHGVPLLKHVVALPGAEVCRDGAAIRINGQVLGLAQARDRLGRDLPHWQGCHRLDVGEVFLMNPAVPDSFDGRYFGPLPLGALTARLQPIWTLAADPAPLAPSSPVP
ncbi:S26 family signal peptidase [Roseicyclus mahoneyensis]|uniref:Conjugative transfer signal peptidase TraF n=1 Tax=Roseicyclus mahoneyensis TaxID=164332 RepID=A0A316GLD9_9RHOB|nr:S26 family signal peptidase [Roseicyclus mahoneyensis]PWK61997.1 conjugative transfer signal peptidase TraF [Roseicyclus mahoneyensis]